MTSIRLDRITSVETFKQLVILISICLNVVFVSSSYALSISKIRINSQEHPSAIDTQPRISWWLESSERRCVQEAYSIQVTANDEGELVFDSGEIKSSQSVNVLLSDFDMKPLTRYCLSLTVKDNHHNIATSKTFFDSGLMDSGWSNAQWIQKAETWNGAVITQFRKKVQLKKNEVQSAYLCTSALGVYDLFINGKRVGHINGDKIEFEELKPGWTDYRYRVNYSSHEVSDYLIGETEIAICAIVTRGWWRGRISQSLYENKPVGFLSKLVVTYKDGTTDVFVSDNTWKARTTGALQEGDIYDGELFDARLEDKWKWPDYDDNSWRIATYHEAYNGKIEPTATPAMALWDMAITPVTSNIYNEITDNGTDYGVIKVSRANPDFPVVIKGGETFVIDFGQNLVGYTPFTLKGEKGTTVRIRYGEMLNDTGDKNKGNDGSGGSLYTENLRNAKATLKYILGGSSIESYCTFSTFYGFRYCEIVADDDVEIIKIEAVPVSSAIDETGSIATDNQLVNKLYENIKWGQRGNFIYIPTDCPQRNERHGWTGDAQVFCGTGIYNFSTEPFYRAYIQALRDGQDEQGAYPDVAPYKPSHFGNAGWADAGIIIPCVIYNMYGAKDVLKEHYSSMEKYMLWLAEQGQYQGAGIDYGDWLAYDKCDNRYVSVVYYAYVAKLMSEISQVLSNEENDEYSQKSANYLLLHEQIKNGFIKNYWGAEPTEKSQTALLMALAFDLLDTERIDIAKRLLVQAIEDNDGRLSTGFLGTPLLLPTLSKYGMQDLAYSMLLQTENPSWLYSVIQGATTIWERWDSYTLDKGFGPASMNSFNHYAYGAVGEWMYRNMAGIQYDEKESGFKHFFLKPEFDRRDQLPEGQERMTSVSASYTSNYGIIKSNWNISESKRFDYECTIPPNTTATLQFPSDVNVNLIHEGKQNASEAEGVTIIESDTQNGFLLESGHYHFYYDNIGTNIKSISEEVDNPSKGVFVINGNPRKVLLYSINGVLLNSYTTKQIDISHYKPNIYLLECEYESGEKKVYKVTK